MGLLSGWLVGEYRDKANSASNSVGTEFEAELGNIGFVYRSTGICQLVLIGLADRICSLFQEFHQKEN